MKSPYKPLVDTTRLRKSTSQGTRTSKQDIGSDRGRVLFSAPFRRLQSKAQVFSLESNAAVRSRLTHSIEVSHIGRYLVQRVGFHANKCGIGDFERECEEIESIIETACLLHDIGNPPFGHLGESAIQEWFKKNSAALYSKSMATDLSKSGQEIDTNSARYRDIEKFDGNPQGLRICLNLQGAPGKKGFNLTLSQIASLIKYPKSSTDTFSYNKIGVFSSELDSLKSVWKDLDIEWGVRHPLVFLMEAADDIAYCLSDIEDGIEKNIITEKSVLETFELIFPENKYPRIASYLVEARQNSVTKPFVTFRTKMINELVDYAALKFSRELANQKLDDCKSLLEGNDELCVAIEEIKKYCRNTLYLSAEAEDVEIAGYNIVYGLLDKFSVLLEMSELDFSKLVEIRKGNSLCCRMFSKLPDGLVKHYEESCRKDPDDEWFHRVQLVVDYISGMTDDFALKFFRLVHGIEVQVI